MLARYKFKTQAGVHFISDYCFVQLEYNSNVIQGEELNKHLASVPIPKRVLYVFACMLIVKLK